VVPDAEVARSEVVEVRLARKVGPLFGVPWPHNPFGRTWVCDFSALTLAEIGRGAPYPSRAEQARLDGGIFEHGEPPGEGGSRVWRWSGRAVWTPQRTPTPAALANATMNRFGPDTKAAVVLIGANRLLRDATAAVEGVCRHLARSGADPQIRLAVWAGLVLEVYRAQPALVVAAVQARTIQRALMARWGDYVDTCGLGGGSARSELGHIVEPESAAGAEPETSPRPVLFDLVDATLPLAFDGTRPALTPDAMDDMAAAWCRRLLRVGRPGRGVVWLAEDVAGHRRANCYLRVGAVVAPFVAEQLGEAVDSDARNVPAPPSLDELAQLGQPERRAHLLSVHVLLNYLRYRDDLMQGWPGLRELIRQRLAAAVGCARELLGADDPVTVLLAAYERYVDAWDLLREGADRRALRAAVDGLAASQEAVTRAWRAGRLDPGAATYLLEIGNVALEHARPVVGDAVAAATLQRGWVDALSARGLNPRDDLAGRVGQLNHAQVFHLHHHAAYLAGRGRRVDLRRALAIQEAVTRVRDDVARAEPVDYAAKHTSARIAHELACRIATQLLAALPAADHGRRRVMAAALNHARAVLDNPTTTRLLLRPDADVTVVLAARSVLPSVVAGLEARLPEVDGDLADRARELLAAATGYLNRTPECGSVLGAEEVAALAERLGQLEHAERAERAGPVGDPPAGGNGRTPGRGQPRGSRRSATTHKKGVQ
jgi:hypothetical protein